MESKELQRLILDLAVKRGSGKSFCPSEVLWSCNSCNAEISMDIIRACGAELIQQGKLVCTQKGKLIDPMIAKGPIRFRLPPLHQSSE